MIIGCFALVQPFTGLLRQLQLIREIGIDFADLTDNHNGGMLGVEFGFAASVSLDSHPSKIRDMAKSAGIQFTSFCAHANLLDPISPDTYGTFEIIKAIRLAHLLGIQHVITTEGSPKTEFGHSLTYKERLFSIREKLYAPIQWAEELGIELLIETHGIVTDSLEGMGDILELLGHENNVGICLDTGNCWLGGSNPIEFIRTFANRIKHVHWKDLPSDWEEKRASVYGCGMSPIALGDGVVGIPEIVSAVKAIHFDGATTLEVAGMDHVKLSISRLNEWNGKTLSQT